MTRKTSLSTESSDCFVEKNSFALGLGSTIRSSSASNRAVWRRDRCMAIYHNATSHDSTEAARSSDDLKKYIADARADPAVLKTAKAVTFFAAEIGKSLFALLLKSQEVVNRSLLMTDLGMDLLEGIELRAWWTQVFEFDVSVLEMLGKGTLEALGQHAAEDLMAAIAAETGKAR